LACKLNSPCFISLSARRRRAKLLGSVKAQTKAFSSVRTSNYYWGVPDETVSQR
jgi:hypothetical protein